jgi:hypothetical protein
LTTRSLPTASATGSTIRYSLGGHTREISSESEKLARRPPGANRSTLSGALAEALNRCVVTFNEQDKRHGPEIPLTPIWSEYVYAVGESRIVGFAAVDDTDEDGTHERRAFGSIPVTRARDRMRDLGEVVALYEVTDLATPISPYWTRLA